MKISDKQKEIMRNKFDASTYEKVIKELSAKRRFNLFDDNDEMLMSAEELIKKLKINKNTEALKTKNLAELLDIIQEANNLINEKKQEKITEIENQIAYHENEIAHLRDELDKLKDEMRKTEA